MSYLHFSKKYIMENTARPFRQKKLRKVHHEKHLRKLSPNFLPFLTHSALQSIYFLGGVGSGSWTRIMIRSCTWIMYRQKWLRSKQFSEFFQSLLVGPGTRGLSSSCCLAASRGGPSHSLRKPVPPFFEKSSVEKTGPVCPVRFLTVNCRYR